MPRRIAPGIGIIVQVRGNATDTEAFRLIFVCTGNICRSPFAEMITRHLLVARLGERVAARFEVSSAGVGAVVGAQMHPYTRDELMPWGLDGIAAGRFAARQLQMSMVHASDLVLGANPSHRSMIVERSPESMATSFSVREFARLANAVDPAWLPDEPVKRARALVEEARKQRGLVPMGEGEDRIPDPMGRPHEAHRRAAMLIVDAVKSIVDRIAPSVGAATADHRSDRLQQDLRIKGE